MLQLIRLFLAPARTSPADGLSRFNIGQIEPGAKDGSRLQTNIAPEGRFRGQEEHMIIPNRAQDMGADSGQLSIGDLIHEFDPWIDP